jgi:4-carboxymuconolactone decarboxylase
MSRLDELKYEEMTAEQQNLHDEILSGPRNRIGGPMNGWFRSPTLGSLIQKVGAYCRYHTTLEAKLSELAILIVAREWNQSVEWWAHQPLAIKAGLKPSIPDAIENRSCPEFQDEREETVYEVTQEILNTKKLSDITYNKALNVFGEKTLFELTAVIGYYTSIAIQMNCFDVGIPQGAEPRLSD